jgi:choline dehydrogenase-like flavoprotein
LTACGVCDFCVGGRDNICQSRQIISIAPREGAFAERIVISERNLVEVPDAVAIESGRASARAARPTACQPEAISDDDILHWIRARATTIYHPTGICRMGQVDMAVVDERLRVRGIEGLRVADASIMPTITSGNTNAPAIMIGEKAAMMIRDDARARLAA